MGERQNREIPESEEEQEDPPREIADVPAVAGDTTIADAFERVVRSGRSVVLVHTDDERHLYAAESLHAAMNRAATSRLMNSRDDPRSPIFWPKRSNCSRSTAAGLVCARSQNRCLTP
jgi:hypothetical protein